MRVGGMVEADDIRGMIGLAGAAIGSGTRGRRRGAPFLLTYTTRFL